MALLALMLGGACSAGAPDGFGGLPGFASGANASGPETDGEGSDDATTGDAASGDETGADAASTGAGATSMGPGDDGTDGDDGDTDDDVPPPGTGEPPPDSGEPPPGCVEDVDVVFVMDVSTSMGPFLGTLANEILAVDAELATYNLPSPPRYGLVVFVDDVMVAGGGAAYVSADALRSDFIDWAAFTSTNQQIGGGNANTTWPENSLDGLYAASQSFDWRPAVSTTRIIIHTTDDTFWDGPTVGNGVPIQHGYAQTQAALQAEQINMYSFAALIGGECECLNVSAGWFGPYGGLPSMANATGGGVFDIDQVLSGAISLSEAIPGAVVESLCDPYPV
ncbi:MAG: hypothetical protein AB1Z98_13290 [Nannocystaceae bacterium]